MAHTQVAFYWSYKFFNKHLFVETANTLMLLVNEGALMLLVNEGVVNCASEHDLFGVFDEP